MRVSVEMLMATTAALLAPATAVAQTGSAAQPVQQAPGANDPTGYDEIVVTARKREENILSTPLSVTALTARTLEERSIKDLKQVAAFTPSLTVTETNGNLGTRFNNNVVIRGMTPSNAGPNSTIFIDGAPVSSGLISNVDDLARVEVLKGPQSTYFGRQTLAGAINLVTKVPGQEFAGRAEALYGEDNLYDIRAAIEGPIVRDVLSARISARRAGTDGQYRNVAPPGERLGDQKTTNLSAALHFTPDDRFSIKLYGLWFRDRDGPTVQGKFTAPAFNCAAGAAGAALNYFCGVLPNRPNAPIGANQIVSDQYKSILLAGNNSRFNQIFPGAPLQEAGLRNTTYHAHAAIDWDVGFATLSSLTAVNNTKGYIISNIATEDARAFPYAAAGPAFPERPTFQSQLLYVQTAKRDVSQELRLTTDPTKRLRVLAGINYARYISIVQVEGQLATPAGYLQLGPGNPNVNKTIGLFGAVSFDILPVLEVSLEGRYQEDRLKSYTRVRRQQKSDTPIVAAKYKNFLPRAVVNFKPTPDSTLYASYSKGVNPGVFNSSLTLPTYTQAQLDAIRAASGATLVVEPEKLESYEIGAKGSLLDGKLRASVALYTALWSNQIVTATVFVPGLASQLGVQANLGKTRLKGIELEADYAPVDMLRFNAAFSLNDSRIKDYRCSRCLAITGSQFVTGNQLQASSKYTGAAGAELILPVGDTLKAFGRADYVYKAGQYADETNLVRTRAQQRVNVRAGIRTDQLRLEAFVNNLFNNRAPLGVLQFGDGVRGGANAISVGLPVLRQAGVRAAYSF